jgi:hypothetical protein
VPLAVVHPRKGTVPLEVHVVLLLLLLVVVVVAMVVVVVRHLRGRLLDLVHDPRNNPVLHGVELKMQVGVMQVLAEM